VQQASQQALGQDSRTHGRRPSGILISRTDLSGAATYSIGSPSCQRRQRLAIIP
jgi:hypothetical protein